VHVYFPDPWWKKRHHKRRILRPETIEQIERVLCDLGRFHLWTDVEEYFQFGCDLVAQIATLARVPSEILNEFDRLADDRTHFDRRMRLHAKPVYRAVFEKSAG
jgi:tRNA (guanine-N7-)-methyltransferase